MYSFEIYKDEAGEYRVRFKYNSEIMFLPKTACRKAVP